MEIVESLYLITNETQSKQRKAFICALMDFKCDVRFNSDICRRKITD